jgi:transposase
MRWLKQRPHSRLIWKSCLRTKVTLPVVRRRHQKAFRRLVESHPLRLIRCIVNQVLAALDGEFGRLYAAEGRPSIAPERLLRALLLQAFYSIRSERQLMEQLHYNLLYRWFVGLGVDDRVWVPTVFTKNRDRLLEAEVARKFLAELLCVVMCEAST